jgi:energy-coupling factor transport system substrate-specific component
MNEQKIDNRVRLLAIVPMGVAINLAIGLTVSTLKLPIFLDAIGTVLFTVLCGWQIGATVGVLSFLVGGLVNPLLPYFVFTQFTIAGVAGIFASKGWFKSPLRVIVTGVVIGYAAALVTCPVIAIVFGGITNSGESLITAFFIKTGQNLWQAVATTKAWTEPLDKTLQCLAAIGIAKSLPKTLLSRLETPKSNMRKNGLL